MNDLIDRLRVSAGPVEKLLLEAADALQNAHARVAELTGTLRAVIEIGNSQRSREFADVKKTLAQARALLSETPALPPAQAMVTAPPAAATAPAAMASVPQLDETKHREEEIVSGMYQEIQNLLRHSA